MSAQEVQPANATPTAEAKKSRFRFRSGMFVSLEVPAFRKYFFSFFAANFAMQNQEFVRAWLAYDLRSSGVDLGLVVFLSAMGQGIGALFGGAAADRFDRRRVIMLTQGTMFISSAILGMLVVFDVVQLWHLLVLALVSSVAASMHMPARQAFMTNIVGPKPIANALALGSMVMSLMRIVGPAVAGIVIATSGVGAAFYVSVGAFAVSIITLQTFGNLIVRPSQAKKETYLSSLLDGARYLYGKKSLFWLFVISTGGMMIGLPFKDMLTPFGREALDGDAKTVGTLGSMVGIGAICASILAVVISNNRIKGRLMLLSGLLWGAMLVALSRIPSIEVGVPVLMLLGGAQVLYTTMVTIVLQTNVEDAYRGRILGFHIIGYSLSGITALVLGFVIDSAGVRTGLLGLGILLVAFMAILGYWRKDVRATT